MKDEPHPIGCCPHEACRKQFKNVRELGRHMIRRHPGFPSFVFTLFLLGTPEAKAMLKDAEQKAEAKRRDQDHE